MAELNSEKHQQVEAIEKAPGQESSGTISPAEHVVPTQYDDPEEKVSVSTIMAIFVSSKCLSSCSR